MKILLVDDSRAQRFIEKKLLTDRGVPEDSIEEAPNGMVGLEKGKSGAFNLIIVDWNMPEMDGASMGKNLREAGVSTPIIMVTSEGEQSKIDEALKAGINDFITKPLDEDQFWGKARGFLNL